MKRAAGSSEAPVLSCLIALRYNLEDFALRGHHHDELKSDLNIS
jgi:hypothetical protein